MREGVAIGKNRREARGWRLKVVPLVQLTRHVEEVFYNHSCLIGRLIQPTESIEVKQTHTVTGVAGLRAEAVIGKCLADAQSTRVVRTGWRL